MRPQRDGWGVVAWCAGGTTNAYSLTTAAPPKRDICLGIDMATTGVGARSHTPCWLRCGLVVLPHSHARH